MILTLGSRATLTLPVELRRKLCLDTGDPIEVNIENGRLILTPVTTVPRRLRLTPEGEAKEREAESDIKSGKLKSFDSAEELIKDLHANIKSR